MTDTKKRDGLDSLDELAGLLEEAYRAGYSQGYEGGSVDAGLPPTHNDHVCPWDGDYAKARATTFLKQANVLA